MLRRGVLRVRGARVKGLKVLGILGSAVQADRD